MVQPLSFPGAILAGLALTLSGCALFAPPTTDDSDDPFVHRAYTSWSPLPSRDGSQLALVLEPRRVDADSHGVVITGWRGAVTGDGVLRAVAGAGAGTTIADVPRGFHEVDGDDAALFVWTSDVAAWTPIAPNDPPPPSRWAQVTWLDRATLGVQGTHAFDPPLERPYGFGAATIIDAPRAGASDVERDVAIRAYALPSGSATDLHVGRGFAVASCARATGLTVAYQPAAAPTTTIVVDVAYDDATATTHVATLALEDLKPESVTCRSRGTHAAVLGVRPHAATPRAVVLGRDGDTLATTLDVEARSPAALSDDGATLAATGDDGALVLFSAGRATTLALQPTDAPVLSGDRALFVVEGAGAIVRLDGARPATTALVPLPPNAATFGSRSASSLGDGRFLVFDTSSRFSDYADVIARAFVVGDAGTLDLPLGAEHANPSVAYADATRAYVVVTHGEGSTATDEIVTIDLASRAVTGTAPFPLCDPAIIRGDGRCSP